MVEHRFEFQSGDFTLRVSGDRDYVEAMVARHMPGAYATGDGGHAALPEPEAVQRPPIVRPNITLSDFIALKEVSEPGDRVLALVYFLERYEYLPNYDRDDLQPHLATVALDAVTVDRAMDDLCRLGLLIQEEGRFSLTFSGEQRVKYGDFPTVT